MDLMLLLFLVIGVLIVISRQRTPSGLREGTRAVLLVLLALSVAGFGLCGAAGTLMGVAALLGSRQDASYAAIAIIPGVIGLALAFLAYRERAWIKRQTPPPKRTLPEEEA